MVDATKLAAAILHINGRSPYGSLYDDSLEQLIGRIMNRRGHSLSKFLYEFTNLLGVEYKAYVELVTQHTGYLSDTEI